MTEQLTRVPYVREFESSNPRATKSYTALQTVRRYVVKISIANSLHASTNYVEYNERDSASYQSYFTNKFEMLYLIEKRPHPEKTRFFPYNFNSLEYHRTIV